MEGVASPAEGAGDRTGRVWECDLLGVWKTLLRFEGVDGGKVEDSGCLRFRSSRGGRSRSPGEILPARTSRILLYCLYFCAARARISVQVLGGSRGQNVYQYRDSA